MLSKIKNIFFKSQEKAEEAHPFKSAYNALRPAATHGSFCYAPMNNIYFSWDGKAIACCFNQDFILGRYPQQTIREIWESKEAKELRTALENFDLSKGCNVCLSDVQEKRFEASNALRFDNYERKSYPAMMEFQLSNTCNLQCVMCNGHLSSSIRKHRDKLPPLPEMYDAKFVDQLEEFIPHLEHTTFSGGEPFLINIYFDIWGKMIALNPKCIIKVITNGTVFNARIAELLKKGNFHITISLDSPVEENYEQIRIGANFKKVISNARAMSAICQENGTNFNLNFCPMVTNWHEIPIFLKLANELNASIYYSIVYFPLKHSISEMSKQEQIEVVVSTKEKIADFPENQNLKDTRLLLRKITTWSLEKEKEATSITFESQEAFAQHAVEKISTHYKRNEESLSVESIKTIGDLFQEIDYRSIYLDEFLASLNHLPELQKFEEILNMPIEEAIVDVKNRYAK